MHMTLMPLLLLVACGKDATSSSPAATVPAGASAGSSAVTPEQQYIASMRAAADAMCACKDDPCTERVAQEAGARNRELFAKYPGLNTTPAEDAELTAIGERSGRCMAAAMQAGSAAK